MALTEAQEAIFVTKAAELSMEVDVLKEQQLAEAADRWIADQKYARDVARVNKLMALDEDVADSVLSSGQDQMAMKAAPVEPLKEG